MYVAKTNASIGQAVVHPGSDLAGDESIPSTMDEECPFKVFLARCAPVLPAVSCPRCHYMYMYCTVLPSCSSDFSKIPTATNPPRSCPPRSGSRTRGSS